MISDADCILWQGHINKRLGYGTKPMGKGGTWMYAHRWAWEEEFGPIPDGLQLHHLCGTKACVNVDHMALLSASDHGKLHPGTENLLRYHAQRLRR